jgi:hypothetical protein
MKIAVISMCIGERYQKLWKAAIKSKEIYCNLHNYKFIYVNDSIDKNRKPHWTKVKAIQNNLADYDWVFYSDADAQIMNFDIKLESIIEEYSEKHFLIITKDKCEINSGNFLIKNCSDSFDFLNDVYSCYPTKRVQIGDYLINWNDQYGFYMKYKDKKYVDKINIINQRVINSYPCFCCGKKYQAGDFIIHFVNATRPTHNWAGDSEEPFKEIQLAEAKTKLLHLSNHIKQLTKDNNNLKKYIELKIRS